MAPRIRPEDVRQEFSRYYEACEAVYDLARANRPVLAAEPTDLEDLRIRTYARASKSFQAGYKLAFDGYGVQALMVGRSVYEDMLVAHWIDKNPSEAPGQFARYERLQVARALNAAHKAELWPVTDRPGPSSKDELDELRDEFGRTHSWTKLGMDKLKDAVKTEFPTRDSHRRLLNQVHAVTLRLGNLAVHHSFVSLDAAVVKLPDGRRIGDVGPSPLLIPQALWILFFSYLHLLTLFLDEVRQEDATRLWHEHHGTFTTPRADSAD